MERSDPDPTAAARPVDPLAGAQTLARPLVYFVVAAGSAISVVSVLIATGSFGAATAFVTLLAVVPYLVFARLALLQPGADAVAGGIVLLAVGAWGSISYLDNDLQSFVFLPLYLLVIELIVFGLGAVLRSIR